MSVYNSLIKSKYITVELYAYRPAFKTKDWILDLFVASVSTYLYKILYLHTSA